MLIHLLTQQPRVIFTILANTPLWVWGVLAALLVLGASQCSARTAGLRRVLVTPLVMALFSATGMASAFGVGLNLAGVLGLWLVTTAAVAALLVWLRPAPVAGVRFDAADRRFQLPGSPVPLLLIVGIFLVKYGVGVELAMQPGLANDRTFALQIALGYGLINSIFMARAARLLWLARADARTVRVVAR